MTGTERPAEGEERKPVASHAEIRSNIRDTAKWLIISLGAIVTFAIGSSTLTQLGSLEGAREWVALIFLGLALLACVAPLLVGIDAMTMRVYSREEVFSKPKFKNARQRVEKLLLKEYKTRAYQTFASLDEAYTSTRATGAANSDVVRKKMEFAADHAVTQFCILRFDRLLFLLKICLPLFMVFIVVFLMAANPPKAEARKAITPVQAFVSGWNASDDATLEAAGMKKDCIVSGTPTFYMMTDGLRPEVLAIPFDMKNPLCKMVRVSMDRNKHLIGFE
ncbi:hypothetical protein [Rhizobium mayense]|uniref:Uncharacterized protein n=1 Tax=Rhizobium mayense TaxID=1312184 RepID=A0ABT7K4H2_9HYPH|nr:hypothetical protein [Rhizobium mayense]MDL2403516.1 hypothetical protein [Rhizobium mayense]